MDNLPENENVVDDSVILLDNLARARNVVNESDSPTSPYPYCHFIYSLLVLTTDIIKKIWSRPNYEKLRSFVRKPTLFHHIESRFTTEEWVECLMIILRLPVAPEIVQRCNADLDLEKDDGYFVGLFYAFWAKEVTKTNRVKLIKTFLDVGLIITIHDVNFGMEMFGFNEEIEILIAKHNQPILLRNMYRFPTTRYIFGWNRGFHPIVIFKGFENLIETEPYVSQIAKEKYFMLTLKYFSLSKEKKEKLKICSEIHLHHHDYLSEALDAMPVLPSLRELSRNCLFENMRKGRNFKYVYELHNAFKSLDAPREVIDMIRFKKPIYC